MTLALQEVSAAGYRSLRRIRFPVGRLSVFVGANGTGKTNLYRALQLLQAAAAGTLSRELALEGGMMSALWAGKRDGSKPVRMVFEVVFDGGANYGVDIGLAPGKYIVELGVRHPTAAAFGDEPQLKRERLTFQHGKRTITLLERNAGAVHALTEGGERVEIERDLMASETALGSIEDPSRFPDLYRVRQAMLDWRFYHDLRTDTGSPLRQPCLAVATPTLASHGNDLAAVLATLVHIRQDTVELDRAIDEAFPGARVEVPIPGRRASFGLRFADHPQRVFEAHELSDGTLRYLGLMGALLSYRLPAFIALNEPEASLHPDLLDPLARLIARAAQRTQIWLVTVIKRDGATWIEGLTLSGDLSDADTSEA